MIEYSANALGAVLAIAVVVAIPHIVRPAHEGWLRWSSVVGIVGYAVIALQYLRELALIPALAERYLTTDLSGRAAVEADLYLVPLDPQGWVTYGAVGTWLLTVNILALSRQRWARPLSYVGLASGTGYWFVVAGTVLRVDVLVSIAAAVGVLLAPVWLIWVGLVLRRVGGQGQNGGFNRDDTGE